MPVSLQDSAAAKATSTSENQAPVVAIAPSAETVQAQAANVFTSKRIEPKHQTAKIAMILGLLALAILAVFAYWYQFVFNQPDVVIPPRPAAFDPQVSQSPNGLEPAQTLQPAQMAQTAEDIAVETTLSPEAEIEVAENVIDAQQPTNADVSVTQEVVKPKRVDEQVDTLEPTQTSASTSIFKETVQAPAVEETLADNEQVIAADNPDVLATVIEREESALANQSSIKITQKKTESGVNAILMRAYEAYNNGHDAQAQSDYKVVLQRYGLNVDAMLGLGAIATRQGRSADAQGWYQQVLQVEPRNDVAKAGLLSLQGNQQQGLSLSQIKSMLQASPTDANLQATLGDVYAQQGQWADAQQAYFEAYRLKQSAENAFNLAVSLDQMGKAKVALPYYKEARMKAGQSSVIDKASLDARISSIE